METPLLASSRYKVEQVLLYEKQAGKADAEGLKDWYTSQVIVSKVGSDRQTTDRYFIELVLAIDIRHLARIS